MVRPRATYHHRALSEPEQRELQFFVQPGQQHVRRFEILKSTALGLVFPQNLQLEVRDVDFGISTTGYSNDLESKGGLAFVTSEMKWWKEKYILPPCFEMFPAHPDRHPKRQKEPGSTVQSSEIKGLPPSPPYDSFDKTVNDVTKMASKDKADMHWPLAKITYLGWQGVFQMTVDMTIYKLSQYMVYDHSIGAPEDIRSRWAIARQGLSRTYTMASVPSTPSRQFKWRGGKKVLDIPEMQDGWPKRNGNLRLEDTSQDNKLVAVYKQRRDWTVMGTLTVFMENLREDVPVEAIVGSCLAIVMYERICGQNLFGQ